MLLNSPESDSNENSVDHKKLFVRCLTKAMFALNVSRHQGHLVFGTDYLNEHKEKYGLAKTMADHPKIFKDFILSRTNDQWFEPLFDEDGDPFNTSYRLQPNKSAFVALDALLNDGMTFVECRTGRQLAVYLAIKYFLIEVHGKEQAKLYFDALFGSDKIEVVGFNRLAIVPDGETGVQYLADLLKPALPISYFIKFSDLATNCTPDNLPQLGRENHRTYEPGSLVTFANHKNYSFKHSNWGDSGNFNAVFIGHNSKSNQDEYLVFGIPGAKSESQLIDKLWCAYNQRRDTLMDLGSNSKVELCEDFFPKVDRSAIPGFRPDTLVQMNWEHVAELATLTPEKMAQKLTQHMSEQFAIWNHLISTTEDETLLARMKKKEQRMAASEKQEKLDPKV